MQKYFAEHPFIKKVLILYLIWWMAIALMTTYVSARLHMPQRTIPVENIDGPSLAAPFLNFDSGWYYQLVQGGYPSSIDSTDVFYPLYPGLTWALSQTGLPISVSGLLINFIAGGAAVIFLALLIREYSKSTKAIGPGVMLFLFFPTAFFMTMFYTEAIFCALVFASFYFARTRRWPVVGILLALLSATRLPGLVAAAAIAVEYMASKDFDVKKIDWQIAWLGLAPIGFLAFGLWLYRLTGDPLAMIHAYGLGDWPYMQFSLNIPWTIISQFVGAGKLLIARESGWQESVFNIALPVSFWLGAVIFLIVQWRKLPVSYRVYILLSLIMFSLNSNFVSVNRYILSFFPVFIIGGVWASLRPERFAMVLGLSAMLMGIWLLMFVNGYFVA